MFKGLLNWELDKIVSLLDYFSKKNHYVLFSSEIFNKSINKYFSNQFNTYDFNTYKKFDMNKKKIIFLKDIDGYNLFDAVNKSSRVICPEGIICSFTNFFSFVLILYSKVLEGVLGES